MVSDCDCTTQDYIDNLGPITNLLNSHGIDSVAQLRTMGKWMLSHEMKAIGSGSTSELQAPLEYVTLSIIVYLRTCSWAQQLEVEQLQGMQDIRTYCCILFILFYYSPGIKEIAPHHVSTSLITYIINNSRALWRIWGESNLALSSLWPIHLPAE